MSIRGFENPLITAADTAGLVSLLGLMAGGRRYVQSLAAKKRRAVYQ